MKTGILAAVAAVMLGGTALAQELKPAIVFDMGGKFDKSFNEAAYNGIERFKKETGVDYREFEITADAQREQAIQRFARDGHSPVIVVGFSNATAMNKVAAEFPNTRFTIIDGGSQLPNVRSALFAEHEGSYLVGVLAGMASTTNKVGFVGGMDIPLIRKFACGYVQGVKAAKPNAEVIQNMTGTTGAAFRDPAKGAELAKSQLDRGADVIYHAAGGTGIGVLRTVAEAGKLGIGVDSNQNGLHPGRVLTSYAQARRQRRLRDAPGRARRQVDTGRRPLHAQGGRRGLGARRQQPRADHPRHAGGGGQGGGGHQVRRAHRARLHDQPAVPVQ